VVIIRILVVINNPDQFRRSILPDKTDPELIINADAMLPCAITLQGFKAIAGRMSHIAELSRIIQRLQFSEANNQNRTKSPALARKEKLFGLAVGKGTNHALTYHV